MTESRERFVAWAGTLAAVLYFAWLGATLARAAKDFGVIFQGLGADTPPVTSFVVTHHAWLVPVMFGVPALVTLGKEAVISDKRVSMMITMLIVILVRWCADAMITAYYLPLFDLIRKLG
jgi:hypothetical protein